MTVLIDGEPWFVAKDVCEVLGIAKYRDAISDLDDDEKGRCIIPTPGGTQQMTVQHVRDERRGVGSVPTPGVTTWV